MNFEDEQDYIMRMIKEMVRVLFSLMFGKTYISVEEEKKNKAEVSGMKLPDYLGMVDEGKVNEAENILLGGIDYSDKESIRMAAVFYQYLSEKDEEFLQKCNYSKEEILDGMKQLLDYAGYGQLYAEIDEKENY